MGKAAFRIIDPVRMVFVDMAIEVFGPIFI